MTVAPTPARRAPRGTTALLVVAVLLLAAILVVVLVRRNDGASSGGTGSGVAATQARVLPPFTGVDLVGSNVVRIAVGQKQSVVVRADSNLIDRVTTRVQDGTLQVDTRGSFQTNSPMSVDVTVPSLADVRLGGSGVVVATGVRASRLTLALPGSGVLRVSGTVGRLAVTLDGSGDAELHDLVARRASATVDGSGRIVVHATEALVARVAGTGAIVYVGSPTHLTRVVTGTGAIIPG